MKIAHITAVFPPYKGGMGQVPYHFVRELKKLGADVEVITPRYTSGKIDTAFTTHYIRPIFSWGLGALCPQLVWQLRKYDVVHLHYPAYGMAIFVWLWKKLFGRHKKLYIFYHMDNVGSGFLGVFFRIYSILFRNMILNSADTIQVSTFDYIKHSTVRNYFTNHKEQFTELPFGVTSDFVPGSKHLAVLQQFNIDPEKKIILFVGGLGEASYFKGPDVLIKSCGALESHDWHLVFVGKGNLIPKYKELAKQEGIADRVTFTGWQSDEDLLHWYQSAYVFAMPSIDSSEAFGIVYLEAMACGVPVIGADLPGVRQLIVHEEVGYVVSPKDVQMLTQYLNTLLTQPELRDSFSQTALKLVEQKYRWELIGKKLLQLYA